MKTGLLSILFLAIAGCTSHLGVDLEKTIGKTPPMGWNSWNYFRMKVSADIIKEIADGAKKYKLDEAGYQYLVIDDGWQEEDLGSDGQLVPDRSAFPDGIEPLVQYVKERGFELGIYSCPNIKTCGNRAGSLGNEALHARQFADWGCKFVKYDYCPTRNKERELGSDAIIERYRVFGEALHANDPEIVYALCEKRWVAKRRESEGRLTTAPQHPDAFTWCSEVGGVMWRTTQDIGPNWKRIMRIVDEQEGLAALSGPDSFNDPDMLEVGNGNLTEAENRAHFSLWCMLNAPLILGNDLRTIPENVLEIITNKELIALNQDLLCRQAEKVIDRGDIEVFTKPLANGDVGVCILNRSDLTRSVRLDWENIGLKSGKNYTVRDLWLHNDLGQFELGIETSVPSHDVFVCRISQ